MTISDIGSIGELLAAIATLGTLFYLATQIRQNTRAVRAASHHAVTDSFNHINAIVGTDPNAARIFRLGLEGLENLNEDEQFSFSFLMLGYMRVFETLFYQRDIGAAEEQLYKSEHNSLNWVYGFPGGRDWWQSNVISFSPEFREHIDQLIHGIECAS
jgi:hypothetical protein